jgi:hypothetical protein
MTLEESKELLIDIVNNSEEETTYFDITKVIKEAIDLGVNKEKPKKEESDPKND